MSNRAPTPGSARGAPAGSSVRTGLAVAAALAGLVLAQGCAPVAPALFEPDAIRAVKRLAVLPLADAPGPDGKGSGRVVAGVVLHELVGMGRFEVLNVSGERLNSALAKSGLAVQDCYDPAVAAAVGRDLEADAVVCGELPHFGTEQEQSYTAVSIVGGGGTSTTHWVSVNLRLVRCADARIVYAGSGSASSRQGYSPAVADACKKGFAALDYLLKQK